MMTLRYGDGRSVMNIHLYVQEDWSLTGDAGPSAGNISLESTGQNTNFL
jgi:hypothetical protein